MTEIFRIKSNLPAVSMALINDKYYTLKKEMIYKGIKANRYKIMKSGEDYIKNILSQKDGSSKDTKESDLNES